MWPIPGLSAIPLKVWAFLALVIIGLGGVWYTIHSYTSQIEQLTSANAKLTADNVQLRADVKTCTDANASNIAVIEQLRNDKKNAEEAKKQMEFQSKRDKQNIQNIMSAINSSPVSDNGKVAPVLKNTVDSIIQARKEKVLK